MAKSQETINRSNQKVSNKIYMTENRHASKQSSINELPVMLVVNLSSSQDRLKAKDHMSLSHFQCGLFSTANLMAVNESNWFSFLDKLV